MDATTYAGPGTAWPTAYTACFTGRLGDETKSE